MAAHDSIPDIIRGRPGCDRKRCLRIPGNIRCGMTVKCDVLYLSRNVDGKSLRGRSSELTLHDPLHETPIRDGKRQKGRSKTTTPRSGRAILRVWFPLSTAIAATTFMGTISDKRQYFAMKKSDTAIS
jgi:hypothetical protein